MRTPRHRRCLAIAGALAVALLVVLVLRPASLDRSSKGFKVQDTSFYFTFCKITRGTNHTVVTRNRLLGMINRKLLQSRIPPVSHDGMYSFTTPYVTTLLSIGYRHDGDLLKSDPNGMYYPDPLDLRLVTAIVIKRDGSTLYPQEQDAGYIPQTKVYVNTWKVPVYETNLVGCELRLLGKKYERILATYRLK